MLVLLDNNIPRGVVRALAGNTVKEARDLGWAMLRNGDLLKEAEQIGFEVLVTADKNMRYQQNLAHRRIGLVVLSESRRSLVRQRLPEIGAAVNGAVPGSFVEVEIRRATR